MKNQKGHSLTEILIVIGIVLIVGGLLFRILGNVEIKTACAGGYKHAIDRNGNSRQIMDATGLGVKCDGQ